MAYTLSFITLTYLMLVETMVRSHPLGLGKGLTPHRLRTRNPFEKNAHLKEDFGSKVICYENYVDVKDLNDHKPSFSELVEAQGWEISMMSTLESRVSLPQI